MSDTPEPLAAILAEMRNRRPPIMDSRDYVAALADRIEAAYKREHAEWHAETDAAKEERNRIACKMRYEFAAKCRACKATPGNAAAMREALEEARKFLLTNKHGYFESRLIPKIAAALAAPARNCDRPECATAEGAIAALRANPCADHDFCKEQTDCAECAARWLVAPAEGGAA